MKKNITLSAEESLIEKARRKASLANKTLNQIFRDWLSDYVESGKEENEYYKIMERLSYARTTRKYSREEMNER